MRKTTFRGARAAATIAVTLALVTAAVVGAVTVTGSRTFVPSPQQAKVKVLPRVPAAASAAGRRARERVSAAAAAALRQGDGIRAHSSWPAAGSGTAVLPAVTTALSSAARRGAVQLPVAAGGLPVTVARAGHAADAVSRVKVRMLSHEAALRAGVPGVLLTLSAQDAGTGPVRVSLGYGSFRNVGGADFTDRLRLVELPSCVLTTPRVPACQVQTPLPTVNDAKTQTVSATGQLTSGQPAPGHATLASLYVPASGTRQESPAVTQSQLVLAATTSQSGSDGTFGATPLRPSGTWSAGGSSGDFTWSYPVTAPPSAGGRRRRWRCRMTRRLWTARRPRPTTSRRRPARASPSITATSSGPTSTVPMIRRGRSPATTTCAGRGTWSR